MISPKSFLYEHDAKAGIATITLNRPERLNALTFEVYADLRDLLAELPHRDDVRAIQTAVDELKRAAEAMAQHVHRGGEPTGGASSAPPSGDGKGKEDVIDAEFEVKK